MLVPITLETNSRIAVVVYGSPGVGKTSLLRTIPEGEKACVISAESGLLCVRDLIESKQVEGFEVGSLDEMREVYSFLLTSQAKDRYKWIFIDSLTEIGSRAVEQMQTEYPLEKDKFKLWGAYSDAMTGLIKGFRDLSNYSVVFTALNSFSEDDYKRRFVEIDLAGGKLKSRLPGYFDEVFYMKTSANEEGKLQRYFYTEPTDTPRGHAISKDRSGKLNSIEKPDLAYIHNKIFGTKEK
ncbi:ATP-binding protein [Patescibacteria group bacterium]|nr:ATP-binding protein [Patescibacteria group bacterium]